MISVPLTDLPTIPLDGQYRFHIEDFQRSNSFQVSKDSPIEEALAAIKTLATSYPKIAILQEIRQKSYEFHKILPADNLAPDPKWMVFYNDKLLLSESANGRFIFKLNPLFKNPAASEEEKESSNCVIS